MSYVVFGIALVFIFLPIEALLILLLATASEFIAKRYYKESYKTFVFYSRMMIVVISAFYWLLCINYFSRGPSLGSVISPTGYNLITCSTVGAVMGFVAAFGLIIGRCMSKVLNHK